MVLLMQSLFASCGPPRHLPYENGVVTPLQMGIDKIADGEQRYQILYDMHSLAINAGLKVSYRGLQSVEITIPPNAKPIPLRGDEDFAGVTIRVKNTSKDLFLFNLSGTIYPVAVDKASIDSGSFSKVPELKKGKKILVISDRKPWVEQRHGRDYGAFRKDVLVLENGEALNPVVSGYNNSNSDPICSYYEYGDVPLSFGDIVMERDSMSTRKTMLINIENVAGFEVHDVIVRTPENALSGDGIFTISNCADFCVNRVVIDGTYSQLDNYGYGFNMNGVYNCSFKNLDAFGDWGVFGTNNVSEWIIEDSQVNRIDIHCYGRDVVCRRCNFRDRYNSFSSVFGSVRYEMCSFTNFTPYANPRSYNAYTPIEIYFIHCSFDVTEQNHSFVEYWFYNEDTTSRPELVPHYLPGIHVEDTNVSVPPDLRQVTLLKIRGGNPDVLDTISSIDIRGLKFYYKDRAESSSFDICSLPVKVTGDFYCNISDLDIIAPTDSEIKQGRDKYHYPGSMSVNIHGNRDFVSVLDSRLNYNANTNYEYDILYKNCTIGFVRATPYDLKEFAGKRRTYYNCKLYLNCADSEMYYLDNLAKYENCTFIPCSQKKVSFWGSKIEVEFKDCKSSKNSDFNLQGDVVRNLKASYYDGKSWRVTR